MHARYSKKIELSCEICLAVQDERGPRKSKTPKITESNSIVSKSWKTRSKSGVLDIE